MFKKACLGLLFLCNSVFSADSLFKGCMLGDNEKVKRILDSDPSVDQVNALHDIKDEHGTITCTPLYAAIRKGHLETTRLLLRYNLVNPNEMAKYSDGAIMSPLFLATYLQSTEAVKDLLKVNADLHSGRIEPNGAAQSPLNRAAGEGYTDIVRLLLDNNVDLHNGVKSNNVFVSPLYTTVEQFKEGDDPQEKIKVITLLLKGQANVDLGYVDKAKGITSSPLWVAANRGYVDFARLLIEAGASLNKETKDKTPYRLTKSPEIKECIKGKIAQGQDECSICLESMMNKHLHFLSCCNHFLCVSCCSNIKPSNDDGLKKCSTCRSDLGPLDLYEFKSQKDASTQTDSIRRKERL